MQEQRDSFGVLLKAIRQERGLFQTDLAELAGVPQPFVSRLERGEIDLAVLTNTLRVIRTLDVSPELLDRVLGLRPVRCEPAAFSTARRLLRDEPVAARA